MIVICFSIWKGHDDDVTSPKIARTCCDLVFVCREAQVGTGSPERLSVRVLLGCVVARPRVLPACTRTLVLRLREDFVIAVDSRRISKEGSKDQSRIPRQAFREGSKGEGGSRLDMIDSLAVSTNF